MNVPKKYKQIVHEKPRCSVTKLGEYVSKQSSPVRRRQIVQSQKIPPSFQTVTYTPVTRFIVDNIIAKSDDEVFIEQIGEYYQNAEEADKPFEKTQAICCHDALRAYRKVARMLDLDGCELSPGSRTWAIEIAGVTVSIRPEIFLKVPGRGGASKVGFVKFYFCKANRLDEHAAAVISAVMIAKAQESLPTGTKISNDHVLVIDVFGQQVFTAPPATKRYLNQAEAACEEIAYNWGRFSVPS